MKTQTLASAFQHALARASRESAGESAQPRENVLLAALQRSATGLDVIVQRRIGLALEDASTPLQ